MLTTRSIHRTAVVAFACSRCSSSRAPPARRTRKQPRPARVRRRAAGQAQLTQDLRSPDAGDAQRRQDLRPPRPTATPRDKTIEPPLPARRLALPPRAAQPGPGGPCDGPSGSGLDWTTIVLGIAGSLLVLGGIAAVVVHGRRAGRAHISA